MSPINFEGLGVALVTPFNSDKSIDFGSLGNLCEHIISGLPNYLVVFGTTGESPTLSPREKKDIENFIISKVGDSIPLVLGIGGNNTMEVVRELNEGDYTGFSAILSVVPPYSKPTQEGIYQHFKFISEASPLPVILYNVPGRTGVNMSASTTLRLARDFKNIIGIKEASGKIDQIEEIVKNKPVGFQVISGDDGLTFSLMQMGVAGVISVLGNAYPKEFGTMVDLCLNGRFDKAKEINDKFKEFFRLLFVDGNPAGIKCLLSNKGLIKEELRLPLVRVSEGIAQKIKEEVKFLEKN